MRRRFWRAVAPKLAGWRLRSGVPRDSLRGKGEELAAVGGRAFLLARAPGLALAVARELEQGPPGSFRRVGGWDGRTPCSCKCIYYFQPQFSCHHYIVRALSLLNFYLFSRFFGLFLSYKGQTQEVVILLPNKTSCRGSSSLHTLGLEAPGQGNDFLVMEEWMGCFDDKLYCIISPAERFFSFWVCTQVTALHSLDSALAIEQ